jgi:hypothetical protein
MWLHNKSKAAVHLVLLLTGPLGKEKGGGEEEGK